MQASVTQKWRILADLHWGWKNRWPGRNWRGWNVKVNSLKLEGGDIMAKKGMTQEAASRIQSHADRTGTNQGFKERAQSAAAKNKK